MWASDLKLSILIQNLNIIEIVSSVSLFSDGQEEFEFRRQLFFWVESFWEVNTSNAAVRVDLDS